MSYSKKLFFQILFLSILYMQLLYLLYSCFSGGFGIPKNSEKRYHGFVEFKTSSNMVIELVLKR